MSQPTQAGPKHPWMRLALCVLLVCVTAQRSAGQVTRSQPSEATTEASQPLTPDRVFALASPAVVKLVVKDEDYREIGQGSGFVVEAVSAGRESVAATLVTNYHVIRPAVHVHVVFANGDTGSVSLVLAEDESSDVAVLMAMGKWTVALGSPAESLPTLEIRNSENPPVGARVYVIGSPQGLANTLSEGLVSGFRERGERAAWIQITAPISPGSSGGPLLSADGTVLGMTTATVREGQNLNFAIPASEMLRVLNGPKNPREVWEGASIRETEADAFKTARLTFYAACDLPKWLAEVCKDLPASSRKIVIDFIEDDDVQRAKEECLNSKARDGDQLALLVKARELYSQKAYDMLRRATEAKAGDFAHLVHFALARTIKKKIFAELENRSVSLKDLERTLQPLKVAKDLKPDFAPTVYWLASTYDTLDSFGNTAPELLLEANDLVRLMPRCYEAYRFRGTAWAELGRAEAFERDFAMAIQLRPNDQLLLWEKARGYGMLKNDRRAVETYKEAIELDPDSGHSPMLYYNLARIYQGLGDCSADAIAAYEKSNLFIMGNLFGEGSFKYQIARCRNQLKGRP